MTEQVVNDTQDRPEPPVSGSEASTLMGSLERQRNTFIWKCSGLDSAGIATRIQPSAITLGGLLKHLALIEDYYFSSKLLGQELGPPWSAIDWDSDPDWEWRTGAEDDPAELVELWRSAVQRSRAALNEILKDGGVDQPSRMTWPDGRTPSVRRILVDLIEEYARHVGQADLIRESIDGLVGEDPPGAMPAWQPAVPA